MINKYIIQIIITVVDRVIQRLLELFRPKHRAGYSDGTTEKELKDKAKEDGWEV